MNLDFAKVQPKKLFEPANREELLRGWLLHAHKGRDRHDLAARRNDTLRYWLGVPTVILSAVVGTSVFASLGAQVDTSLKIVIGLVSITSAVLASLQNSFCRDRRFSRPVSERLKGGLVPVREASRPPPCQSRMLRRKLAQNT